jgi:transposase
MSRNVAAIDVHKALLVVVVAKSTSPEQTLEGRRFGTGYAELCELRKWLLDLGVEEAVMESTAQYWKPVWLELEPHLKLHLAQAHSNRAPVGRKSDMADAKRLLKRFVSGELFLSFVPGPEQRSWRTLTRARVQLVRQRARLQNQIEALLEEARIKLSAVISDLLGASGRRILRAIAEGQEDPEILANLGDERLRCTRNILKDALTGSVTHIHRALLRQQLDRIELLDRQISELSHLCAAEMVPYQNAVVRLVGIPGISADTAQEIIAEVGPAASAFPSAPQLASWVGVCPGSHESAGNNKHGRSAKGNCYLRRVLSQAAQAAVRTKGSHLQSVFKRLIVRAGYCKAIWAIAHRLCRLIWAILHEGVDFVERGEAVDPNALRRCINSHLLALPKLAISSLYSQPSQRRAHDFRRRCLRVLAPQARTLDA